MTSIAGRELAGFSRDQADALVEVVNIGFGKAASLLSNLVGSFVKLQVPGVERVEIERVPERLAAVAGGAPRFDVARQAFRPRFRGECLLAVDDEALDAMYQLLEQQLVEPQGRARSAAEHDAQDGLLEVANILCGALVGKLSEVIGTTSNFSAPDIVLWHEPAERLVIAAHGHDTCLMIHAGFVVERLPVFRGWVMILLAQGCLEWLRQSLDRFARGET